MNILEAEGLVKSFGRRRVVDGVNLHRRTGRDCRVARSQRCGQDNLLPHDLRHAGTRCGNRLSVRAGSHILADVPPCSGRGHGLPGSGIECLQETDGGTESALHAGVAGSARAGRNGNAARNCWNNSISNISGNREPPDSRGANVEGLEIARCLVSEPEIIMLDEPFAGIDPVTVQSIQSIICDLQDQGISILITDHAAREILQIVDRCYVIASGKVLRDGAPRRDQERRGSTAPLPG